MELLEQLEHLRRQKTRVQIFISSFYSFVGTIDDVNKDNIICIEEDMENNVVIIPLYKVSYVRPR